MLCRRNQKPYQVKRRNNGGGQIRKKNKEVLTLHITENKNTQPLLGLDWLDKNTNIIRNRNTDERYENILNENEDLLKNIHTIEGLTINIELKKDIKSIQQKGRPVHIHFQKLCGLKRRLETLIERGHLEKADKTTENFFLSPAVTTMNKDELTKIALASRKLNESCVKRKATMPNMEELISKISAKITKNDGEI